MVSPGAAPSIAAWSSGIELTSNVAADAVAGSNVDTTSNMAKNAA
jgi:hypothetical protein